MPRYPVEVLWCPNNRHKNANGWSFPRKVAQQLERDCSGKRVLHLFGGQATFGTRLDVDMIVDPDVIGDAWLPPFAADSFDIVILDPPYTHLNSQMKNALLRGAAWIARERVVWFSTFWISAAQGLSAEQAFLLRVGDNCFVRCLQYFRVVPEKRRPVTHFQRGPQIKYNRWLAQPQGLELHEVAHA